MTLRIRRAVQRDIEGIADCAERFFEYAQYEEKFDMPFDRASFKEMVERYIKDGICILTVDKEKVVGGICGMIAPWGYNKNIKLGYELFYWMDKEHRGRTAIKMFDRYEREVISQGARSVMVQPETFLTDKVGRLYERRGYKKHETFWVK